MATPIEAQDGYSGWVFRLNAPRSNIMKLSQSSALNFDEDEVDKVENISELPLLPNDGLPRLSSSSSLKKNYPGIHRYLAELSPHGVKIAAMTETRSGGLSNSRVNESRSKWSWSYSSRSSPSQWNVTSAKLLSITYRPAHEAYPSYTNISIAKDYWHRSVGTSVGMGSESCSVACQNCHLKKLSNTNNKRQQHSRWNKIKRKILGTPNPIHRVKVDFTVEDILYMESVVAKSTTTNSSDDSNLTEKNGVWIRGIGTCHALRIYLKPKFGSFVDSSVISARNNENMFQSVETDHMLDQHLGFELPQIKKWDNLQLPPWKNEVSEDNDNECEHAEHGRGNKSKQCGPVLTFAIPCQTSTNNSDTQKSHVIYECPPLLWKVDHPPNPRVAIDSMTLMEASLHLRPHPDIHVQSDDIKDTPYPIKTDENNIEVKNEQNNEDDSSFVSYDYDTPTNVYIHGYQSWSFSGSVVQGEPQPKSAMPNIFSEAFNRGGEVLSLPAIDSFSYFDERALEDGEWHEDVHKQCDVSEGDSENELNPDEEYSELNESTAFYKSDMFACISSNGASSQHDEDLILLDEEGGPALIVGFLSQRQQFGVVLLDSALRRFSLFACHEGVVAKRCLSTDWAYCQVVDSSCYDEEAMVYYAHAVGDHNDARPMEKGLTCGWCSWYHYYADIDHDSLSRNAHLLEQKQSSIGFNVCLIDDGYMTAWGDWSSLKPGKFLKEGGMRVLADTIRSKGMKPGVWLAPFACDKFSQLSREHPEWIIKNDSGRFANSASCGKFFYGLDATNPAVRKHVYDTISLAVEEWGFEVLKLDFLYASCLAGNGKYDNTMSRAEAMYLGLQTIKAAAKNAFIIGCGCPIGSAVGFVDGMRVSCDTGPSWVPEFPLPHWDYGTLPALKGMLRNTMSRAPFGHRWWHNDPDCILLGESTKLSDDEVVSAASIVAMTGGMFLLSDDMQKVKEERLNVARRIYPLTGVTAIPLDLHSTMNNGMPSILRLWCTEYNQNKTETDIIASHIESLSLSDEINISNNSSTLECELDYPPRSFVDPYSRERSCFLVAPGLGTWTIVSLSNWMEHDAKLNVSLKTLVEHSLQDFAALGSTDTATSPGEQLNYGFHVFSFWSSEYTWISHQALVDRQPLIKKLRPHETEIFHIKAADPKRPQYIGSDLHFSCGFEVLSFEWSHVHINLSLKNDSDKSGCVFLYIPGANNSDAIGESVMATIGGEATAVEVIARPTIYNNGKERDRHFGRVIKVCVTSAYGSHGKNHDAIYISWKR